jgi:hypothetical protein
LSDCVPPELLGEYAGRLLDRLVEPHGRLIVSSYGSRSRATPALPIAETLASYGYAVAGQTTGGEPAVTAFAWIDR